MRMFRENLLACTVDAVGAIGTGEGDMLNGATRFAVRFLQRHFVAAHVGIGIGVVVGVGGSCDTDVKTSVAVGAVGCVALGSRGNACTLRARHADRATPDVRCIPRAGTEIFGDGGGVIPTTIIHMSVCDSSSCDIHSIVIVADEIGLRGRSVGRRRRRGWLGCGDKTGRFGDIGTDHAMAGPPVARIAATEIIVGHLSVESSRAHSGIPAEDIVDAVREAEQPRGAFGKYRRRLLTHYRSRAERARAGKLSRAAADERSDHACVRIVRTSIGCRPVAYGTDETNLPCGARARCCRWHWSRCG